MEISEYEKNKNNRDWNIKRLEKSMNKWRIGGLDKILPEEYIKYMNILQGLKDGLEKDNPEKKFYLASDSMVCPNMKKISLEKVRHALETLEPRVVVPAEIREKAVGSLTKMLNVCR